MNVEELLVAVWIGRTFLGLAIPLQAVFLRSQFLSYGCGADDVPLLAKFPGKGAGALARPANTAHRIPPDGRVDQGIEIREECGVFFRHTLSSSTRFPHTATGKGLFFQMLFATGNPRAGNPRCPLHHGHPAMADGSRFRCTPQSLSTFIEVRSHECIPFFECCHRGTHGRKCNIYSRASPKLFSIRYRCYRFSALFYYPQTFQFCHDLSMLLVHQQG